MTLRLQKPVIYIGARPSDFCVVTPLPSLARYAEEAAREMQIRTCIVLSEVDNDEEAALEILHTENVKLLATRGYTAHILRQKTSVPILTFGYSSENFLETLLPYQNSRIAVGYLCFPEQGLSFQKIASLLGIRGYRLEVEDRKDLGPVLEEAREKNIELLLGGLGLISKAREQGFEGIPCLPKTSRPFIAPFPMLSIFLP